MFFSALALDLMDKAVALAHSLTGVGPKECPALLPIEEAKQETRGFHVSQSTVIYRASVL